jgi:hypothetical protein
MQQITAVVEGHGDVASVPILISRAGETFGRPTIAPNPIRAGEWRRLQRPGELERILTLAASRGFPILFILDLDDGCPVEEIQRFDQRVEAWRAGRDFAVECVFLMREYEALFVACLDVLTGSEDPDIVHYASIHDEIRNAKGIIKTFLERRYKETLHQKQFTRACCPLMLSRRSRSYRNIVKIISEMNYNEIILLSS